ncbi:MAG: alkaline phosphatase [Methylococcaceae bacterium]|nr:alkaline phosphatase [Methylococcaceae bacterium]
MKRFQPPFLVNLAVTSMLALHANSASALEISRLTPPSQVFATQGASSRPFISRFVQNQRFDIQATIKPDAGQTITQVRFLVDEQALAGNPTLVTSGLVSGMPAGTTVASLRAYSNKIAGEHKLTVEATQSDGKKISADGNFEVVKLIKQGNRAKNVIIMLGDGMGASHRTAARIVVNGYSQGKANAKLAMDSFPNTAMIMTASLNSIVTDSAPGMQNYVTGNKANNNQEGVWPDDTKDAFDNPRVEYLSEYLHRIQGKKLGIVTTADVFDATPAANMVHTSNRGNGSGIVDQYLDDANTTGLTVLMGGGRKWFLPNPTNCPDPAQCPSTGTFNGSSRTTATDYVLSPDIVTGWGVAAGKIDADRNLIGDFQSAGWFYAPDKTSLMTAPNNQPLLGLFSLSNMNIALDKIAGRRHTSTIVNDYGFPDQPMLDEMAAKALDVLDANSPKGFVLMVEGASIDKQAHNMDSERWMLDTIEFDRAVKVAKDYAAKHSDTLVIVTADHECSGAVIIGASTKTDADLQKQYTAAGDKTANVRDAVVGVYDAAKFPKYTLANDGYPVSTDPDNKLLIGYGANGDRYEDWRTNPQPIHDTQQPGEKFAPLNTYPAVNNSDSQATGAPNRPLRDQATGYFVTGQVPGDTAVHTGGDIPLTAYGRGASLLGGTIDNTDVFFVLTQATVGGVKGK